MVIESGGSCLSGGVDLAAISSSSPSPPPTVFLPWDASVAVATSLINSLLPTGETVYIARGGDGHASATFTATFLRPGVAPQLTVISSSALEKHNISESAVTVDTTSVTATAEQLTPGGIDLLPLPGRYLTAPASGSVVSVRLGVETTAACEAPNWDGLAIGCHRTDDLSVAASHTWAGGMSLERCVLACAATSSTVAVGVSEDVCTCLSVEPSADSEDALLDYNCSVPCSGDEGQLCGAMTTVSISSVYQLPTTLGTSATDGTCSFDFSSTVTPSFAAISSTSAAQGAQLTLTGTDFLVDASPVVSVCGGRTCAVTSYTDTQVVCTMPDCSASSTDPVVLHFPPYGYATDPSVPLVVRGVVSLTAVRLASAPNTTTATATGSAAGGVELVLTGDGFDDQASRMQVTIMADGSSSALATCEVQSSSTSQGQLACRTLTASAPLTAAGTTCSLKVENKDADDNVVGAATLTSSLILDAASDSVTLESLTPDAGSTEGGLELCIGGTNLDLGMDQPPTVLVGGAPCDTASLTWSATQLCCTTSSRAAGAVDVSVLGPSGYALAASSLPQFTYTTPPVMDSITPAATHAGGRLTIELSAQPSATPVVMIGSVACEGVTLSDTTVECTAPKAPPGNVSVTINVPAFGLLSGSLFFEQQIGITAVSPSVGSAGGGNVLTIAGAGFEFLGEPPQAVGAGGFLGSGGGCLEIDAANGACASTEAQTTAAEVNYLITIGGKECAVVTLNSTEITCIVPPVVPETTDLQAWVNTFYPTPPSLPPPSPPPEPPPLPPPSPPPSPPPPSPPSPPSPPAQHGFVPFMLTALLGASSRRLLDGVVAASGAEETTNATTVRRLANLRAAEAQLTVCCALWAADGRWRADVIIGKGIEGA